MENHDKKLYSASGTIQVKAHGYWFTSGGEKGSFGFYPHLKDADGYPVFPDTQIQGDLKMAASWLKSLNAADSDNDDLDLVFGQEGRSTSSLLKVSDLELTDKRKDHSGFFEIKPRIRISEETGTVETGMLADREMSYLKDCVLESKIYLGYCTDEKKLQDYKNLITNSAEFLSGFGGLRSRGYSRGDINVKWDKDESIEVPADLPSPPEGTGYFLEALVNFRSKPVEPGDRRVIGVMDCITPDQIRGWFVKTYHDLFGVWPTTEEMETICFPILYPSDAKQRIAGYPPPMTTLKNEDSAVIDCWGMDRKEDDLREDENFFNTKTKPLSSGTFVANTPDGPDILTTVKKEQRMRNYMDETFTTKQDGLFGQELIKRGTCFGGVIRFKDVESIFSKRAGYIIKYVRPIIKGALFQQTIANAFDAQKSTGPFLVIEPMCLDDTGHDGRVLPGQTDQITIGVSRAYNTILKRPRRNRIVIAAGSVLDDQQQGHTVAWTGFGQDICKPKTDTSENKAAFDQPGKPFQPTVCKKENLITRTRADLLRVYLHPHLKKDDLKRNLDHRILKYRAKNEDVLLPLLKKVRKNLESGGITKMRGYISTYLEELSILHYLKKRGGSA